MENIYLQNQTRELVFGNVYDHNPSYGSLGCVIQIVCPISLLFYDKVTKDVFYKTNPCFGNEPMHGGLFR